MEKNKKAQFLKVYEQDISGCLVQLYDLQFVYSYDTKLWSLDITWPNKEYDIRMAKETTSLFKSLDYKGERRIRLLVHPSNNKKQFLKEKDFIECKMIACYQSNAVYQYKDSNGKMQVIGISMIILEVLDDYPQFIYFKQINIDGTILNLGTVGKYKELLNTMVNEHFTPLIVDTCHKLGIVTLRDLMYTSENAIIQAIDTRYKANGDIIKGKLICKDLMILYSDIDNWGLNWGTEAGRELAHGRAREHHDYFCYALEYSLLNDLIIDWKEAEIEYSQNGSKYEDVTQYDPNGNPYVILDDIRINMPDKKYDDLDIDDLDVNDAEFLGGKGIMMLLNRRKFVKKR